MPRPSANVSFSQMRLKEEQQTYTDVVHAANVVHVFKAGLRA